MGGGRRRRRRRRRAGFALKSNNPNLKGGEQLNLLNCEDTYHQHSHALAPLFSMLKPPQGWDVPAAASVTKSTSI